MPHPQTVWDAAELTTLQNAHATTHAPLATHLGRYMERYPQGTVAPSEIAGYAMITRILGDTNTHTANAINGLMAHCAPVTPDPENPETPKNAWRTDYDLNQADDIRNAAIAYDVLYDLLAPDQRATCRKKIATYAKLMADAADGLVPREGWWVPDLLQNHNWIDFAAIGVAGQALEGDEVPDDPDPLVSNLNTLTAHWRDIARINFENVRAAQDLIPDGSWHEGLGYMEFGLIHSICYWMGAVRRGNNDNDKSAMLRNVGRYILYTQMPNHPRIMVMTHGDWNWSRPQMIAVLRWTARRFDDSIAQEAARRWDLEPRLTRHEYGLAYAVEYVAFNPAVALPDMNAVPLDVYNEDQQSFIMRNSWGFASDANGIVAGFKAGVHGGRGNRDRMKNCVPPLGPSLTPPGGMLNFSHDHEDDLSLWIYGKGGWLLPEAAAYKVSTDTTDYFSSTRWHNSFLFDGAGQLGDNKSSTGTGINCGSPNPAWFWDRDAQMPLHVSTDHYAFARGDGQPCTPGSAECPNGRGLYPAATGVQTLLRTVGFSRENGGFFAVRDRIVLNANRTIEQVFRSLNPGGTNATDPLWLKLDNSHAAVQDTPAGDTILGIRVLSPSPFSVTILPPLPRFTEKTPEGQQSWQTIDDDGNYGYMKIAPQAPQSSAVFLEVLWPTKVAEWGNLPTVQALDTNSPQSGFSIQLGASKENWIYNTSGNTTSAGGLTIEGSSADDIGIKRSTTDANNNVILERLVMQGGTRLSDQMGLLLDLSANQADPDLNHHVLEVAFTVTPIGTRADLSGTAEVVGVKFRAPDELKDVYRTINQQSTVLRWSRSGSIVTVQPIGPPVDVSPPVISGVRVDTGIIDWNTSEPADSQVEYGTTQAYGFQTPLDPNLGKEHRIAISGLAVGTSYYFRIKSKDAAGNLATSEGGFQTAPPADVSPPSISDVRVESGGDRGIIDWNTSEPADSQVEYGTTQAYGFQTKLDPDMKTDHTAIFTGLQSKKHYFYRVKSKDAADNLATYHGGFYNPAYMP